MIYILVGLLLFIIFFNTKSKAEEVEGSNYFHVSDGASRNVYIKMHKDGASREQLKKYVDLEDRFLRLEKLSICSGLSYIVQATILSNKIKESFPKYNFSYHTIHLKQIAEPNKRINLKITCS
jgi:hypothetical protein